MENLTELKEVLEKGYVVEAEEEIAEEQAQVRIICSHCKKDVIDCFEDKKYPLNAVIEKTHYYKCRYHKKVFCDFCCHNFYQKKIAFKDTATCLPKELVGTAAWKDCIFIKCVVPVGYDDDRRGEAERKEE